MYFSLTNHAKILCFEIFVANLPWLCTADIYEGLWYNLKVYDVTWKSMMSLENACSELALWLTSVTEVQCDHCVTCVPKSLTLAINYRSTGSEVAWKCLLKPIPVSKFCPMKLSPEKQLENHLRKEQDRAWVWKSPMSLKCLLMTAPLSHRVHAVVTVTTLLPF